MTSLQIRSLVSFLLTAVIFLRMFTFNMHVIKIEDHRKARTETELAVPGAPSLLLVLLPELFTPARVCMDKKEEAVWVS